MKVGNGEWGMEKIYFFNPVNIAVFTKVDSRLQSLLLFTFFRHILHGVNVSANRYELMTKRYRIQSISFDSSMARVTEKYLFKKHSDLKI